MKRILVTGGAGFIGTNFVSLALERWPDCRIVNLDKLTYAGNIANLEKLTGEPRHVFIKGDISDQRLVESLLVEHDIDWIVNFAAETHVDRSILEPGVFGQTNFMGTLNLLACARAAWEKGGKWKPGCLYYQVSTDEVYGSLGDSGYFTEQTPLSPRSPYSASKTSADMLVMAWHHTYGMPTLISRCSNNYGPYQFPEKLIPLIILNCLKHKPLPVYGDGLQVRDWLHVEDHCRAIAMLLEGGNVGEVYNIGGHNERTNIHVVKTIIRWLHDNVDQSVNEDLIRHVEDRKGHDRRYGIDPTKITTGLGWVPEIKFEDGIERTIRWYLDHTEWIEGILNGDYMQYYEMMYANRRSAANA